MSQLRKRGLVAAAICTEPFLKLGRAQAKTFGVPDLPLVLIPHPLGGIDREAVKARADVALAQVIALIREHSK